MPAPLLVSLSGVDCAGKSTQIALLADALRQRGHRPEVFWYRPGYSRELDVLRAAIRRLRPKLLPTSDQTEARQRTFSRPNVRRSWVAAAVADTLLQYGVKIRALRAGGRSVICDRYIHDALLDLELAFPDLAPENAIRSLFDLCPQPDYSFLLMLPRETMYQRMEKKQEPFSEPIERRNRRYEAYATLARTGQLMVLDSTRPIEQVHHTILKYLQLPG